jgi:hypothetical protein
LHSVVGGGLSNTASGFGSVVGGGQSNTASGDGSVVGGGQSHTASGSHSVVGGGQENTASEYVSVVGGGQSNTASGYVSVVGGGSFNTASGVGSVVGGGQENTASGDGSVVGGGLQNTASGAYSAIPGGYNLRVGDRSFGFSGQSPGPQTDLSASSNIAAFVDVDMWLYNVRNQASQLRLYEPSGSGTNYTAFRAQAQASNIVYTLPSSITPTTTVAAGILQTDGSGNLSWVSPSALGGGNAWSLTGNSGTNPTTNFLGTTDAQPLVIRVGNQETFRFNAPGTAAPAWSIHRGGGNTRGLHAVDLQSSRSAATQVASGIYSVIAGGQSNTASGTLSVVGGGEVNTASGAYSAIPGGNRLTIGTRSFGFSGQTSSTQTDLSASSNIAAFVDVDMWLYNVRNQASQLRLYEPSGSGTNYTAFRAQAQASDIVYTMPASITPTTTVAAGILQTDGSGNLSWVSPSALGGGNAWSLTGNSGTNPTTNFLGTTDAQPLVIRVGNQETFRFNAPGTAAPAWSIHRGGGNTRGLHAVDLQSSRSAATQVASGIYSVIAGGQSNTASGTLSVVGGGEVNTSSGDWSVVGGGQENTASGVRSVVGGGYQNTASGVWSFVGGGFSNTASQVASFVGGGELNTASGKYSVVGGGKENTASGDGSFVGGGEYNTVSGYASAIPGGYNLWVGDRSFGFSGQISSTQTDLSAASNIAAFVDVDMWLYNVRNQASQLRLYEPSGSGTNYTAFRAQAQASDIVYTMPASITPTTTVAAGILQTDGSGNLSWVSPSALGGGNAWSLTGNSGTNPTTNFLGTTDAQPLVIRVGNQETFRFNAPGTAAPAWSIHRGGGNTRGLHAVDLQSSRSAATQVASGNYSVIAGGQSNTASGFGSVVGGGSLNTASGVVSVVGGGGGNTASGYLSVVGGGQLNTASEESSVVGGGRENTASGTLSVVGGGEGNTASGSHSFVGGGAGNTASELYSVVGGGQSNIASGIYGFVGGGQSNTASGTLSVVGGGELNHASGSHSVVGGGYLNTASGAYSAIPGGNRLTIGTRSFGFSGQTSGTQTNLSAASNIAAFVDVDMWLYNVRNQASQLRLYEPSGSGTNYTAFRAQAQASDITYTLPAAAGSPGQMLSIQSVSGSDVFLQWSSSATYIRKTANETVTNNSAFQDDDHLFYFASANQVFEFEAYMFISGGTGGIRIRVIIPMDATMKLLAEVRGNNAFSYATLTSSTSEVTRATFNGNDGYARIRGIITTGSSGGYVQIQWGQNTNSGTGTTVEAGSYLKITPVQ